jgi:predicted transposase YdaD
VFKSEVDRTWLKRRFSMPKNILRKAWAYQEILQEGREEGLQEGREKGLQEQRLTLMEVVQSRFPGLEAVAKNVADDVNDLATLRRLIVKMSVVQTEEKAREALLEVGKGKKQK